MIVTLEEQRTIANHQLSAPVDITALATALGIAVYESYDLPEGVSGRICRDGSGESSSGYSISVNAAEPYRRRRFTVAHECAHYFLHRDEIGDELTDNALYRSDKLDTKQEFEANNRAADLLMPRALLDKYIAHGEFNVKYLAEQFDVSVPAMRVRMRYLYQLEN